jgi:MFS family permease
MKNASSNVWAALRNSVFRRFWFATVISGSFVAAQNTATYWALNALGATTVLISVMATVSALPGALFILPAGSIADLLDRKKILLAVQIWQASIVFGLAILWAAHLLNPYLILASTFLLSAGFAFSSPASSAAIAEMVSPEELAPAYTLGGLQLDLSGIAGPLVGAVLLPLIGVSFIFGASGLGFLLMFFAIFQWKRVQPPATLPLETFFESLTTAIRYVRYTAGIKVLLIRHALFSFFRSIIPSLWPVLALKESHVHASSLGYIFTAMAVGSVLSGTFLIPWARAKYSPQRITTGAGLVMNLVAVLGGILTWTKYDYAGIPARLCPWDPALPSFLLFAVIVGAGWTVQASELWIASQRAMPAWARGRMNATTMMVTQGATALGGAVWGLAAQTFGVVPAFLGALGFSVLVPNIFRVVPALRISIDFTQNLSFEPAQVAIFPQNLTSSRLPAPEDGPISIIAQFHVRPVHRSD